MAVSLCVNPMPSRITRKSTRLRVADRTMVDTVQPRVLASFRNPSALSLLMNMQLLRWSKAKPQTTRQDTRLERHSYLTRDWMPRTIPALPAEVEKCLLTSLLIEQAFSLIDGTVLPRIVDHGSDRAAATAPPRQRVVPVCRRLEVEQVEKVADGWAVGWGVIADRGVVG